MLALPTSGYKFKKGYSRSKSAIENSSDDGKKRAKVNKEERQNEIKHTETTLTNVESQIRMKENRMEKVKLVKDFKVCDQRIGQGKALLKEKRQS